MENVYAVLPKWLTYFPPLVNMKMFLNSLRFYYCLKSRNIVCWYFVLYVLCLLLPTGLEVSPMKYYYLSIYPIVSRTVQPTFAIPLIPLLSSRRHSVPQPSYPGCPEILQKEQTFCITHFLIGAQPKATV